MTLQAKKGVLLMNLGSPDSTSVTDVKKYLHEFLMDKRVIDSPYIFRKLLVDGIIVRFRSPRTALAYQSIWWKEGSPLIVLSKGFQKCVQQKLDIPVALGMRYGNPSTAAGFKELMEREPGLEEVILVPLYPHYAMSSYETAVEHAKDIHARNGYTFKLSTVRPFYQEDAYISALASSIRPYLNQDFDQLLFSFHGIPERHVRNSDPTGKHCLVREDCCELDSPAHQFCYRHQVKRTTQLVAAQLGLDKDKMGLSFQSRLGRDPWLTPSTAQRLTELPGEGIKKLLVVCPAFVADCLETLEEMNLQGKKDFLESGGTSFELIPCLNTHSQWVEALTTWIKDYTLGKPSPIIA
ncbi:MAG: ferrochelatase [Chitinophagaceae bacterium]